MPARKRSLEELVAEKYVENTRRLALELLKHQGPKFGSKRVDPEDALDLWEWRDTAVDADALRAEGMSPRVAELFKGIGITVPEDAIGKPLGDPEIGALMYPNRHRLTTWGERAYSRVKQASYADRMNKRSADRAAERAADAEMEVS